MAASCAELSAKIGNFKAFLRTMKAGAQKKIQDAFSTLIEIIKLKYLESQ